jgi:hypothetical protein
MILLFWRKRGDLFMIVEGKNVSTSRRFEGPTNPARVAARLKFRSFPLFSFDNGLAVAIAMFTEGPPISEPPLHRTFRRQLAGTMLGENIPLSRCTVPTPRPTARAVFDMAASDLEDLSGLASFAAGLQFVDSTGDEFRQLAKRWDNRLVLEGFALSELYLNGRIAIALVVDKGPCADPGLSRFPDHSPIGRRDTANHEDGPSAASRRVIFLFLANGDNEIIRLGDRRNKHSMLVHSVKSIERPESGISSSLVRFYDISNFQREIGRDSLYKSVR